MTDKQLAQKIYTQVRAIVSDCESNDGETRARIAQTGADYYQLYTGELVNICKAYAASHDYEGGRVI